MSARIVLPPENRDDLIEEFRNIFTEYFISVVDAAKEMGICGATLYSFLDPDKHPKKVFSLKTMKSINKYIKKFRRRSEGNNANK